jgi:hypothetical protein
MIAFWTSYSRQPETWQDVHTCALQFKVALLLETLTCLLSTSRILLPSMSGTTGEGQVVSPTLRWSVIPQSHILRSLTSSPRFVKRRLSSDSRALHCTSHAKGHVRCIEFEYVCTQISHRNFEQNGKPSCFRRRWLLLGPPGIGWPAGVGGITTTLVPG